MGLHRGYEGLVRPCRGQAAGFSSWGILPLQDWDCGSSGPVPRPAGLVAGLAAGVSAACSSWWSVLCRGVPSLDASVKGLGFHRSALNNLSGVPAQTGPFSLQEDNN